MPTPAELKDLDDIWARLRALAGYAPGPALSSFITGALETTEAMTLYVSPTGNDLNSGLTAEKACRTINGALNKVPKRVRHLVTIEVAAGNYDGFVISNFSFDPLFDNSSCGIFVKGAMSATTELSQGTATGTVTSTVTGSGTTGVYTTVTDATQNWAVDALKGKFLVYTIGATTTISLIVGNTATTISIAAIVAGPANGTAYTICDAGVVINGTPLSVPGSIATLTAAATASANAWIAVFNNTGTARTISIRIEGVRVNPSAIGTGTGVMLNLNGQQVGLGRSQLAGTGGTGTQLGLFGPGFVNLTGVSIACSSSGLGIDGGGVVTRITPSIATNGLLVTGGTATGVALGSAGAQGISLFNVQVESPIGINIVGFCNILASGVCKFPTGSSQGVRARIASNGVGGAFLQLASGGSMDFTNRGTAIELAGTHHFVFDGNLICNTCTNGIVAQRGAKVGVSAGSSMTAVTNEIVIDSAAAQTLAAMRAATPKHLKDSNYFTVVYE